MKLKVKKIVKKNFYDLFKIGLEVEGSFYREEEDIKNIIESSNCAGAGMVYDGSVDSVHDSNSEGEIRSGIITSKKEEQGLYNLLDSIKTEDSGNKFALSNPTAGTHIHFSFKDEENQVAKLTSYDSITFERMFFREYFKTFSLQKFADRIHNHYCRPFINNEETLYNSETRKRGRDRYGWLNNAVVTAGGGMELRIFPYIQTVEGLKAIIAFTKKVIFNYYSYKKTQTTIKKIIEFRNSLMDREIKKDKLNEIEKMIITTWQLDIIHSFSHWSADSIVYLVDLYHRKPSAIIPRAF